MQKLLREYLDELNRKQKRRRKTVIAVVLAAIMLVSGVIWNLTQYGIAMTDEPKCGMEEHTHSDSCYADVLTCGREESAGHTHTETCYQTTSELVCGQEESEEHSHDDSCYQTVSELVCGQEESEGHTHTEACYEKQLVCGKEEHTHSEACYIDTTADVEDASIWNAQYADTKWKDAWGEDLVIAAKKQIGYKESTDNYTVATDGSHKGYTRYGQFAGDVYADWDAVFVNFCMHYAGLEKTGLFPKETETAKWHEKFAKGNAGQNAAYLTDAKDYEPQIGDILFFQKEKEETDDQMGIISSYDKEKNEIKVIEGNSDNAVKENKYAADDKHITAYLKISELETAYKNEDVKQPERTVIEQESEEVVEKEVTTYTERVGDVEVIVEAQKGTFDIPADQVHMTVEELTEEQRAQIEEMLYADADKNGKVLDDYYAFDINLWADEACTKKIQPKIPVTVYYRNIELDITSADEVRMSSIDEEEQLVEEVQGDVIEDGVKIEMPHFTVAVAGAYAEQYHSTAAAITYEQSLEADKNPTVLDGFLDAYPRFEGVESNWQIVKERYGGIDKAYFVDDNHDVRIQKTILPTAIENQFQIFLDVQPRMTLEEIMETTGLWIVNSANTGDNSIPEPEQDTAKAVEQSMHGANINCSGVSRLTEDTEIFKNDPNKIHSTTNVYAVNPEKYVIIKYNVIDEDGAPISTITTEKLYYNLNKNKPENLTLLYTLPGDANMSKVVLSGEGYNSVTHELSITIKESDLYSGSGSYEFGSQKVNLSTVTDPMGELINFVPDTVQCTNSTASFENGEITWSNFQNDAIPKEDIYYVDVPVGKDAEGNTIYATYLQGFYTMSYTVTLDVNDPEFVSCATDNYKFVNQFWGDPGYTTEGVDGENSHYDTNGTTTLAYSVTENGNTENETVNFKVPVVRGYVKDDISFKKVDEKVEPLQRAKFGLYSSKDCTGTPIQEATSDANGLVKFTDIRSGKGCVYYVKEIEPPVGYILSDDVFKVTAVNTGTGADRQWTFKITKSDDASDTEITQVINEPNTVDWQIKKVSATDTDAKLPPGAEFMLQEVREDGPEFEPPLNTFYGQSDSNGIVNWFAGKDGDGNFVNQIEEIAIPNGTYTLTETKAPAGYIKSEGSWEIKIGPGKIWVDGEELNGPDENGVLIYKIENEALFTLPEAGGPGIYWYIFSGILLMAGAMLIIYKNKCREVLKS